MDAAFPAGPKLLQNGQSRIGAAVVHKLKRNPLGVPEKLRKTLGFEPRSFVITGNYDRAGERGTSQFGQCSDVVGSLQ